MLIRCNPRCKMSDGMTDALLDVDTNNVICNECGEAIIDVSDYSKTIMKQNGDVIRSKNKKAFIFECKTCDKHVESTFLNGRLVGKSCENDYKNCKIDITSHMVRAVVGLQGEPEEDEVND